MKRNNCSLLLAAAALSLGLAGTSSAFTAVTGVSNVVNTDLGGPGATVGDSFSVTGGSFVSYLPDSGDPTITGGDLNLYRFNMSGTVTNVVGGVVSYVGLYEIFYDGNANGMLDAGSGPPDFSYSSGTLDLTVDFSTGGPLGPFAAAGTLHQTAGPDAGFPSSGFSRTDATFTGTYTQNSPTAGNPQNGTIQGTVRSVPDGGSSLVLLGLAALGLASAKRKFAA